MKKLIFVPLLMLTLIVPLVFMVGCRRGGGNAGYNFTNDMVLIVLTHSVSIEIIDQAILDDVEVTFTTAFFPELDISEVIFSSVNQTENVRQQRMGNNPSNPINQNTHRITLRVLLTNPSHQTVDEYIQILSKRSDISSASRNYIIFQ